MIKIINNSKVNIAAPCTDYEGRPLSCGDSVLYPSDKGYVIFGWYLGKSPSGKSTYMMTHSGHARQIYYTLLKHEWKEPVFTYNSDAATKTYEAAKELIQIYSEEARNIQIT